jgi:AraC-like DNA-binding protein
MHIADMSGEKVSWDVPLDEPPALVRLGIGIFGPTDKTKYTLPELWSLHLYRYHAGVTMDGHEFSIRPGWASLCPPGMQLEYRLRGKARHLFAHIRLRDQDGGGGVTRIPAMCDLSDDFERTFEALEYVMGNFPRRENQARARVWDTLHELARLGTMSSHSTLYHPVVVRTIDTIEAHLAESVNVVELADEAGISYSYLARLFHNAVGTSIVGYIRKRRVERAQHLLLHSTLPVKVIAATVGIADLQLFNKMIRADLGRSPRALRCRELGEPSGDI